MYMLSYSEYLLDFNWLLFCSQSILICLWSYIKHMFTIIHLKVPEQSNTVEG